MPSNVDIMPKKGKKGGKKGKGKAAEKDGEEPETEKKPFQAPDSTNKELELQKESVSLVQIYSYELTT